MRNSFLVAAAAAVLALAAPANAALVTGFNLGSSNEMVVAGGAVTITTWSVLRTDGLADNSAAPLVTSIDASGDVLTTFNASFASNDPLDLLWFDFNGLAAPGKTASWDFTIQSGSDTVTSSGSFSGSASVSQAVDLKSIDSINSASFEFVLTDGELVDDGSFLQQTGFQGFAAISGESSITVIPEPSMAGVLGLMTCAGMTCVRGRRRRDTL